MTGPSAGSGRRYTVIYDGKCRVCTRTADVLRRWDRGQLEVVASQDSGVAERFPWISAQAYADALQLVGPGGQTWEGSDAVEQLMRLLPRGRAVAWIYHIPFARALADRFYRWFARNRFRLGCDEHCAATRAHPD